MESETRVYFLANACHVCKSKNTQICCEICKMIFYCSKEHRKSNWFDHSELCWALNKICESERVNCLWGSYDGRDFTKFRHEVANKCIVLLKRSLMPWEFEMIYYPRACSVCREFNWENLSTCKNCEFVYTCDKNHFRKDHSKWCKTLKTYSDLIIDLKNVIPSEVEIKTNSPNSMSDVLKQNNKNDEKSTDVQNALASELLTYPLTVFNGLKTINLLQEKKLEVLFIGAERQAEVEPLAKWEKYLLHFLPGVEFLSLKFLGPELRGNSQEFLGDLCENCRKQRKILKFEFITGKFYHEYSTNGNQKPNMICAFNSGMYRDYGFEKENSWEDTIQKLFTRKNSPVLITEYTCRELKMVLEKIKTLCGNVVVIAKPKMNPFASLKPGLNIISENETPVIFKNYYFLVSFPTVNKEIVRFCQKYRALLEGHPNATAASKQTD